MFLEQGLREALKKRIISTGTYAELKNLQITVSVVNIIKRRRRTLTKPASKQPAPRPGGRCPLRNRGLVLLGWHFCDRFQAQEQLPCRPCGPAGGQQMPRRPAPRPASRGSGCTAIPLCPLLCSLVEAHSSGSLPN